MALGGLHGLLLGLLINVAQPFTGVNGKELTVYSSVRDTATLPCNHNHSHSYLNCSLILWINSHAGTTYSTELVMDGNVKDKNQEKSGKLRVESNCSLRINNLTTADVGRYSCRLYNKNKVYFTDAPPIYLFLLSISASSPVTELKIGSTVTLHCEYHSDWPCGNSIGVTWVNETGAPLQGDGYTVSDLKCSSTLTVTLQRSDHNMKWRCQLTEKGKLKASCSYTTTFSGGTYLELPIRLTVFFIVLIIPLLIGTIFYIKRRIHAQTVSADQVAPGLSVDYVNIEMLVRDPLPDGTS